MKKIISLLVWILLLQAIGYSMGMITDANLDPWYQSLNKSSLTPPGFVFGIVWTILYVMLAIVGWLLFHVRPTNPTIHLRLSFVIQLILNWLWTPLFFYLHWPGIALICLLAIVSFTSYFLSHAWREAKLLFYLILPYWLWVCFASYLNFVIWHGGGGGN